MPKTKKTTLKKTTKLSSRFNILSIRIVASMIVISVFLLCASVAYAVRHQHLEVGQYNISDIYVGEKTFRSLDLKVASKASYPSGPLTITKEVGNLDGYPEKVFKYSVKDDDLTEYGLMLMPSTPQPRGGYPVVVVLHGYVNASQYSTETGYLGDMEFYAGHGFIAVKPDLRGQGNSADAGHADSAYYSMSYNTDVLSLVSALKQTKYVDKSNINMFGHSMGAYIALRAAVISPDIKNIILLSGPMASLKEMYLTYIAPSDENNPYALATRNDVFSKYGTPAEDSRFWYDASPINQVERIKAKVQIHVGLEDGLVPPVFSADLDSAFTKARVSHQYFAHPGGDHSLVDDRPQIYGASLQLLVPSPNPPQS